MNKLSWMLYWADTLPSLAHGVAFIGIVLFVGLSVMSAIHFVMSCANDSAGRDYRESGKPLKFSPWAAAASLLLALSSNLVPSKDTFYMIAASEVGEEALQAPEVGKVRKVINNWLDEQIKPVTEETAK